MQNKSIGVEVYYIVRDLAVHAPCFRETKCCATHWRRASGGDSLLHPRYWSTVKKLSSLGSEAQVASPRCETIMQQETIWHRFVSDCDYSFCTSPWWTGTHSWGARRLVCRTDTPEYLLSDCYGHKCGETQWLNQEFKWKAREGRCSAADASGSTSEQHPDRLFSRHRS